MYFQITCYPTWYYDSTTIHIFIKNVSIYSSLISTQIELAIDMVLQQSNKAI